MFALLNDFHQWGKWSPWEKLDPDHEEDVPAALSPALTEVRAVRLGLATAKRARAA